jgi:arginyl-tRNA synthetase
MNIRHELDRRIAAALLAAGAPEGTPAVVMLSAKPEFGDYQANGVMGAAKKLKTNPRQLAQAVVDNLDLSDLAETVEIAGPGFLNITLKSDFLAERLNAAAGEERVGVDTDEPATVVIDYSSPNLAKEMHVGHLRSTIIGDALARVLSFLGHDVKRQNHVGDWGTQFGMLTAYLTEVFEIRESKDAEQVAVAKLGDLEDFYRKAKAKFDEDPAFADKAREFVVKLQGGDETVVHYWNMFRAISLTHCTSVYQQLGVLLDLDDVCGESFYNDDLPKVIADLDAKGLLTESQGAQCVFLKEFTNKDGDIQPFIVKKSDGGYLYATTDLAAIRHRVGDLGGDRLLYVTDARQAFHFKQLFAVARAAGFAPAGVSLEHVPFGVMLGADHKPFKTRDGGTIKLTDLLNESVDKAFALVTEKNPDLPETQRREIAQAVGIAAVKYADLSQNRTSDYVFSWDKMMSLDGNTAPYMQYAYARIRSIFRKGEVGTGCMGTITINEPAERALAVKLVQFGEMLNVVAGECMPHHLCSYLYDLAGAFMSFYEACPVLKADGDVRASRLALCDLTARTISKGLELLGITTPEQM